MPDKNNPESHESEDDAAAVTNPITDDNYSYSDDEYIIHHDSAEYYNTTTIKSKPTMLKKDRRDLSETHKLNTMVKDRFCDPAAEDDQALFD